MSKQVNRVVKSSQTHFFFASEGGFSLFEFAVVLVVISLLIVGYYKAVDSPIKKSREQSVSFQANTFSRSIYNLNGISRIKKLRRIKQGDTVIYFNEFGWPANTDSSMSPRSRNQTAEECLQLWYAIFRNPPKAEVVNKTNRNNVSSTYLVSGIKGHICRYELAIKRDGSYYFDYDLKTGTVIVSTP